jgi:beta-galactosidase
VIRTNRTRRKLRAPMIALLLACAALVAIAPAVQAQSSLPVSPAQNDPRAAALADLTSQLHVGTEFFLNRTETKASVEKHFRLMHDNGITLVRIFIIWDDLERAPGAWNFEAYDWIYDAAAQNNIKIAATLCSEDPPGWTAETPFYHHRVNLDHPEYRAAAADYLTHVVNHFKNHPAQGAWLLMNEPEKYHLDPDTLKVFGAWLQKKYGTIEELNRHRFRTVKSFDDVHFTENDLHDYWTDTEEIVDWRNFTVDNLIAEITWIRGQVLAIDPNHPTHFNVTEPTGDAAGQDVWKEKTIPDILGVSMHAAWVFPASTPESDFGEWYSYRLDLIADASQSAPRKPFWVTELESGPTMYTGQFPLTVTPQDLSRWMWDSYGAGSNAVIFWLWHPRDIGREAGEWALVGLNGEPSVRLAAVKKVADTLKQNPYLAQARPQPARVAILYDRDAAIVNNIDGEGQHRKTEVTDSLFGCYLALLHAHIPTQFVDIDQLKHGEVDSFAVLYAPDAYALDGASIAALKKYVSQGGTFWTDGLAGWKTAASSIRPSIPGGMTDLIGSQAFDVYPVQAANPYSVTAENELGGELWRLPLEIKGAEVVLRDKDGNAFELKHQFGKGQVYYFSSAVSLAYLRRKNPVVQKWITDPAASTAADLPVQMQQGSPQTLFRGMISPAGPVAIISNWGDTQEIIVRFKRIHKVTDAISGQTIPVKIEGDDAIATMTLAAGASALLKAQ